MVFSHSRLIATRSFRTVRGPRRAHCIAFGLNRLGPSSLFQRTSNQRENCEHGYRRYSEFRMNSNTFEMSIYPEGTSIHPTAIVHERAIIAEDVVVGPFCTIGPEVKIGRGTRMWPNSHILGNTELGERCAIHIGAVIGADVPGHTVIGNDNSIGHHAVIGIKCQDLKYKEGDACFLQIGNKNDIREFVGIHRSSMPNDVTEIGNGNLIMGSCHVAHDCKIGNMNILANGTLLAGHVVLKDFVHTGGGVAVHQHCHIDSFAFLAGGAMVSQDVPMYTMASGNRAELRGLNIEGLRRHGFASHEVKSLRRAYQILFMNTNSEAGNFEERLASLELSEECRKILPVVQMLKSVRDCFGDKRRGLCGFKR